MSMSNTMNNINKLVNTTLNNKVVGAKVVNNVVQKSDNLKLFRNILLAVLFAVLLVVLFVVAYDTYFKDKVGVFRRISNSLVPYIHDAKKTKTVSDMNIPITGGSVNYNFWIYISDYKYRKDEDKCIFFKGKPNGSLKKASLDANNVNSFLGMPGVWLLARKNTMRINIALETVLNQPEGRPECSDSLGNKDNRDVRCFNVKKIDSLDVDNIPLQRWTSVNVTINDNVVDVWMDGYLVKSKVLKGFPLINTEPMYICPNGGFHGFLSKVSVANAPLSANEIKEIYEDGPVLQKKLVVRMIDALF